MASEVDLQTTEKGSLFGVKDYFLNVEIMLDQHLGEGLNGITEGVYRQGEMIPKSPKNCAH